MIKPFTQKIVIKLSKIRVWGENRKYRYKFSHDARSSIHLRITTAVGTFLTLTSRYMEISWRWPNANIKPEPRGSTVFLYFKISARHCWLIRKFLWPELCSKILKILKFLTNEPCCALMQIRIRLITRDADPDKTYYPDADPDPDPNFQIKAQSVEKVLK